MEKDFIYRQTLVWLEHEDIGVCTTCGALTGLPHKDLARSLTEHLVNNADQVDKAKDIHHNEHCTCGRVW